MCTINKLALNIPSLLQIFVSFFTDFNAFYRYPVKNFIQYCVVPSPLKYIVFEEIHESIVVPQPKVSLFCKFEVLWCNTPLCENHKIKIVSSSNFIMFALQEHLNEANYF